MKKFNKRKKVKVFLKKNICASEVNRQVIGQIRLVKYLGGKSLPVLEFEVEEKSDLFRRNRLMAAEVESYLKDCNFWGHSRLLAIIESDNVYDIKTLESNGFIRVDTVKDKLVYYLDLNFSKTNLLAQVSAILD